ncbi:hypothetical protein [Mesorhizobium sp. M0590]|uniref:hypothetical protein n=1 Tax=Mesorhizobium sp. M0590 TaxID=2956966 RepID=UPI003337C956
MLSELEKNASPTRRALFAIEVIDSVSGSTLYDRIKVEPLDANDKVINGPPVINHSGKFVWLEPRNDWPARVRVRPDDRPNPPPFEDAVIDTPQPADDPIPARKRLFTALLRPTAAYPFGEGTTAVRGALKDGMARDANPIRDAIVQLAWQYDDVNWKPAAPAAGHEPLPGEARTDGFGQFATFIRLPADDAKVAVRNGLLTVRLQVTRAGMPTWIVPGNRWVEDKAIEKITAGRLFEQDVNLAWPAN